MKTKQPTKGAELVGKIPSLALTKYIRNGAVVTRKSYSEGRRSNSRSQFIQRQRMRHSIALWKELSRWSPGYIETRLNYRRFLSLASQLPVVYMPKNKSEVEGSLLMPGMPVSEGVLNTIHQRLGEVEGTPALITDFEVAELKPYEVYLLYTAEQQVGFKECPTVVFSVREVRREEFSAVDGCVALVDNSFADEMKGWALVRLRGMNCSSQAIVTRCRYYEQFTTEEALQEAAKSYGGLTGE
ncbi:MAG: hypothetical protein J6T03_02805 [Bacteroidales bacterium]|nr:hypothetical protein [Bacteroidales bacterium]